MIEDDDFESLLGLNKSIQSMNDEAMIKRKREGIGCALCNFLGYTLNEDKKQILCSCSKEKFFMEIYKKSNVPRLYIGKTIEDWNTRSDALGNDLGIQQTISEKVYALMKFYIKHFPNICAGHSPNIKHSANVRNKLHSILFEGGIGSGKTFIASVMVQIAIQNGLSAKYYDWSDIIETMVDFDKKEQADEIIDNFKNMEFIALDGVEFLNYNHPQLPFHIDRLAKARINSGKPIMIFAFNNYQQIQSGSGWQSLLRNCLTIRLPRAIN